ncbi:hypothetical protein CFY87_03570 [Actinobacillus seminis]|uniref:FhaB protein n=1 Tax=Actinobacillus seminis TaxID=722 RepID=A0A263HE46_9PAST|nr:hemagglutinin repeat-containing protein [Actinobacillus seminis]OZN25238.1 hypothetical protein CFY87_03570 [Actinobacillus seminis]SUU36091.1 FhaB protein [Actinobacillus seminis]
MNGNSFGLEIEGSAQAGKGRENTNGITQSNTHINGKQVTISSQNDTALRGTQVNANRLDADIKGNLTLESRQDSNSIQQQTNPSRRVGIRCDLWHRLKRMANYSQNQAKVNYTQVEAQSGFHVGNGGMNFKSILMRA